MEVYGLEVDTERLCSMGVSAQFAECLSKARAWTEGYEGGYREIHLYGSPEVVYCWVSPSTDSPKKWPADYWGLAQMVRVREMFRARY